MKYLSDVHEALMPSRKSQDPVFSGGRPAVDSSADAQPVSVDNVVDSVFEERAVETAAIIDTARDYDEWGVKEIRVQVLRTPAGAFERRVSMTFDDGEVLTDGGAPLDNLDRTPVLDETHKSFVALAKVQPALCQQMISLVEEWF